MASDLVDSATNKDLAETDWAKNIEICELVSSNPRQAKDVLGAIKKRMGSRNQKTQLYAVVLLEMLMNNIGESIHRQVVDLEFVPFLVKIVKKKKSYSPVREKIFVLLDATQVSLGGALGKFPQYHTAYSDLVNAGVKFSQRSNGITERQTSNVGVNNEDRKGSSSETAESKVTIVPATSTLEKAANALEVLRDVLEAVDSRNPKAVEDEFTLDLVEQCSFQKQRMMHLAVTSRDEKVVSRAVELNDQLQKVLSWHDALLSRPTASWEEIHGHDDDDDGGDDGSGNQQLSRRRKGKAHASPDVDTPRRLYSVGGISIPPPPSRHMEREKFFRESRADVDEGSTSHRWHQ